MSLKRNSYVSGLTLFTSVGTLFCCALPALFVALGAGATLAGMVSRFPQLVWLSEYKNVIFTGSGVLLVIAGILLWQGRKLPCPTDPKLAKSCMRLRRFSYITYFLALIIYITGAMFAFILPYFM